MNMNMNSSEGLKASKIVNWNASDPGYIDRSVYVKESETKEWQFVVTLDRESGEVYNTVTVSTEKDGDYHEPTEPPSAAVMAAFEEVEAAVVAEVREAHASTPFRPV